MPCKCGLNSFYNLHISIYLMGFLPVKSIIKEVSKVKIFGKMLFSFGIVIVVFVALCIFNLTQSSELKKNGDNLHYNGVEPSLEMVKVAQLTENTRVQMLSALTFKNVDATTGALENLESIQKLVASFKTTALTSELKKTITVFNEKWLLFDERVRLNEQLMRAGDWEAATEGLKLGGPLFSDAMTAFNEMEAAHTAEIDMIVTHNGEVYSRILLVSIILIVIASLVAISIAFFFSRQIVKRLSFVTDRAQAIADGDLSLNPIETKNKDEISVVAASLNNMQDALIRVVSEASDSSQQVSASSEQLSATTQQNMAAAESFALITQTNVDSAHAQLSNLTEITNSLTNMESTLQSIAQNGSEMDSLSRVTFEKTQFGAQAVNAVNDQIQSIAESSKETEEAVKNLNAKSQEIGNIVSMITQIADQTNLLALNAAIESARAGESGKGFAVVADEVKKLAEGSRHSAEQIFNMIREIQDDIQGVIQSIHEESNRVNVGLVKSQEVNVIFNEIEGMVGTVTENAVTLNDAIESTVSIRQNILNNTQKVNELANATLKDAQSSNRSSETQLGSIEEIAAASESLAGLSEQLQAVISHFKLNN